MPLQPGDILENWEIVGEIGEGGMGSVFKARNRVISDVVAAIKVVHPTDFKQARERFEREIKALLRLNHQGVVRIQGFGQDPDRGLLWFAMDLVEGQPLEDVMDAGPMRLRQALPLYIALTEGLAHAHARGVSHRDLKPANVIVSSDGAPVLVDFGISVAAGEGKLTKTGMVVGTPQYLPPEALDGRLDDPNRGDLYAVGQMFIESLDGVPAFPFDPDLTSTQNALRIMHRKVQTGPMAPRVEVPASLRELLQFTTHPDPAQRIATAPELAQRLRQVADELGMKQWGGPTIAPPVTPAQGNKAASTMALDTGEPFDVAAAAGAVSLPESATATPSAPTPTPESGRKRGAGGFVLAGGAAVMVALVFLLIAVSAVAAGLAWVAFMPVDKEGLPTEVATTTPGEDPPDGDIVDDSDSDTDGVLVATNTTTTTATAATATTTATTGPPDRTDATPADGPPGGDIVDEPQGGPDGDIVDEPEPTDGSKVANAAADPPPGDGDQGEPPAGGTPDPEPDDPKDATPADASSGPVGSTGGSDPEPSVARIKPRWRTVFGIQKGASDAVLRNKLGPDSGSNNLYCKGGEAGRTFKDGSIMVCRGLMGGARRIFISHRALKHQGSLPNEAKLRLMGLTPKQVTALVGPPDATVNGRMRYAYGAVLLDVRSGKVEGILIRL